MIPVDILLTALIVAAAAVWAGRGLWRLFRRRMRGAAAAAPACGGPQSGCGHCPGGEAEPSKQKLSSCGDERSGES